MSDRIVLSVGRDVRRSPLLGHTSHKDAVGDGARPGSKEIAALRERVIAQPRHGRRCHFCHLAFGESDHFEVHHLDGDHANDSPQNTVPVCVLCHIPWHLDLVLQRWPGDPGSIIYLPELSQSDLSATLYALFYHSAATIDPTPPPERENPTGPPPTPLIDESSRHAARVYERLVLRSDEVEQVDGQVVRPGLSSVHAMVRLLQSMDDSEYAMRETILSGCRYLPPYMPMLQLSEELGRGGSYFNRVQVDSWKSIAQAHGAY